MNDSDTMRIAHIHTNTPDTFGNSVLIRAAEHGHIALIRSLLSMRQININATDDKGHTALILAAGQGQAEIVQLLLAQHGINFNAANNNGNTALILAAWQGHLAIVRSLLSMAKININATNNGGNTALMSAVRRAHTEIVQILIAQEDINFNATNDRRYSALLFAADTGHTKTVKILLAKEGIHVNATVGNGSSALFLAILHGHINIIQKLLSRVEININAKNDDGDTALLLAIKCIHERVAQISRTGVTACFSNHLNHDLEVILTLLAQPGICVHEKDIRGMTTLTYARTHKELKLNAKIITALEIAQNRENLIKKIQHHLHLSYAQAWAATMPEILELYDTALLVEDLMPIALSYLASLSYDEAKQLLPHLKTLRAAYATYVVPQKSLHPCQAYASLITTATPAVPQWACTDTGITDQTCCLIV